MPYNTTAIPPRKEATGQTQLPLSRVKKIVNVDPDVNICSNNAAFVITLAAEMFVQYLAQEGQNIAKADRKPRRNLQYKDLAQAVLRQESLEFLEDVIPRTQPLKRIKEQAAATQAKLRGERRGLGDAVGAEPQGDGGAQLRPNGKKQRSLVNGAGAGSGSGAGAGASRGSISVNGFGPSGRMLVDEDPDEQLQLEMQRADREGQADDDVIMVD